MKQIWEIHSNKHILTGEFIVASIYVMKAEKSQLITIPKGTKSGHSNLQIGKRKERLE